MALDFKKIFSTLQTKKILTPTNVVGVDLGSSSIKVVAVKKTEDVLTLDTYGELQLGPYVDQELGKSVVLPIEKKIEAVVDVLRESKVSASHGIFTLPLTNSFITVFSITAKDGESLAPRVRVEARKYIPVPMSDVSFEWTELPPLGEALDNVHEVLIVAVQNEAQQELQKVKQSVEMDATPSEIELFSALRALQKSGDSSLAIIDLGAKTSKIYISKDGMVRRIHRVFAGGTQATQLIAKELSIPYEEAENQKRNYMEGDDQAIVIKKAVVSAFERPFQEFRRVLEQYEARVGEPVSRVVLTGGSASFAEMQTYAGYMLDRTVELANPFGKVAYPAFMEDMLMELAPTFSIALGAALRAYDS